MAAVKELETPVEIDEEVSQSETSPSTSDTPPARQPEPAKAPEFDLTSNPQFRAYQAAQDRRVAALERKYQQEVMQARQELENRQLAELDDVGQERYLRQKSEAEREQLRQMLAEVQIREEKATQLRIIAQEASDLLDFSIPESALLEAESPDQAWKLAARYKKEQLQMKASESEEVKAEKERKRAANKPDLGGGAAPPVKNKLDEKFKNAKTTADLAKIWFSNPEDD